MKKLAFSVFVLAAGLSCQMPARAEMAVDFPTHCQAGEVAFLNAKIGKFDQQNNLTQSGKILSLCADKPKEPFGKFVYRFGAIGHVEIEQVATPLNHLNLVVQPFHESAGMPLQEIITNLVFACQA